MWYLVMLAGVRYRVVGRIRCNQCSSTDMSACDCLSLSFPPLLCSCPTTSGSQARPLRLTPHTLQLMGTGRPARLHSPVPTRAGIERSCRTGGRTRFSGRAGGNRRQNFPAGKGKKKRKWRQQTFLWRTRSDGWLRLALPRPGGAAKKADGRKARDRPIGGMIGKERSASSREVTRGAVPCRAVPCRVMCWG